jgi:murein DD-endopeptidase MepM/ murein hydrolase activator NlpD
LTPRGVTARSRPGAPGAAGSGVRLLAAAAPLLLAGLLPTPDTSFERWPWSGAFAYPVGPPDRLSDRPFHGVPPWHVVRGFFQPEPPGDGRHNRPHEGVDLTNGRGGDTVRAAAHGLVVLAQQRDSLEGFGSRVVLAHRLPDGTLAYSVYAHLRPGSIVVHEGQPIWMGDPLGRVGRSGNATGDHLHFELRRPTHLEERWENTPAVDPLVFLAAWLPGHRADTSLTGRYLQWAEESALIGPRDEGGRALTRAAWWEMLARAARHPAQRLSSRPDSLRTVLIDCSVLPLRTELRPEERLRWKEVARDVRRLRVLGVRLPPPPVPGPLHAAECVRTFGAARPLDRLKVIARATAPVDRADACVLLADLVAPHDTLKAPSHAARAKLRGRTRRAPAASPYPGPLPPPRAR